MGRKIKKLVRKTLKRLRLSDHKYQIFMTVGVTVMNAMMAVSRLSSEQMRADAWTMTVAVMNDALMPALLVNALVRCIIEQEKRTWKYFEHAMRFAAVTAAVCFLFAVTNRSDAAVELGSYMISGAATSTALLYLLMRTTK